jgi:thiol-disulfide isomerase/thioredoxin
MLKFRKNFWFPTLIFALLLAILFIPGVRSSITQGLMSLGYFKPKIENRPIDTSTTTSFTSLEFVNQDQQNVNGALLEGKVVFINFWATWCGPCLYEMPSIQKLYHNYKSHEDIVFLMVDVDGNLEQSVPFMKEHTFDLPVYIMTTQIPEEWLGNAIPCTIVLDKKGQLVYRHEGTANYARTEFKDFIQQLVNE